MKAYTNPFEFEAANKFTPDEVLDFFIDDNNHSRFIQSTRNIVVEGARGTGKTMMLLYNSLPTQQRLRELHGIESDYKIIGIYIPCKTPLMHREEYRLLSDLEAAACSNHLLVLTIMYEIVSTLEKCSGFTIADISEQLRDELSFILNIDFPTSENVFKDLQIGFQRASAEVQEKMNGDEGQRVVGAQLTFASGVLTLLGALRRIPEFNRAHFSLMLDDVQDLNTFQIAAINSWISYRDHSVFSFKIATTKVRPLDQKTTSGGAILPGHDYSSLDLEMPYQNRYSEYGKMIRKIIKRRLEKIDIDADPDSFFPQDPAFAEKLEECNEKIRLEAVERYGDDAKRISDYVYKYGRAEYFRSRSKKANRPAYSGFDLLVHISTGVIRNLLEPCYWMYDRMLSEVPNQPSADGIVSYIPPGIQADVLLGMSKKKWEWTRDRLVNAISDCTRVEATAVFNMLDQLGELFRKRLHSHKSEPRAISFSLSEKGTEPFDKVKQLLQIAREAQLIYQYSSTAKDYGKTEPYYVPNRILWPARGLDPHGQHARVSIKSSDLLAAAMDNQPLPFDAESKDAIEEGGLFNVKS